MKTKYLKGITALSIAAALSFSSCLKDNSRLFLPESVQSNLAYLPLSGLQYFATDAVTKTGIDTITFAVGVTAANPPTTSTTVTLAVDNTITTAYDAANPTIAYQPIPATSYKFTGTTVTIPAGKNSATTSLIIDRTNLDPAVSYMLPIKIVSAGGLPISANYSVHYYHIIGNDFAGIYTHDFTRIPSASSFTGHMDLLAPDSPTQFEVVGGYFNQAVRYVVTFTKTGGGATAAYSNFNITINPDDVTNYLTANSIAVTTAPTIVGYTAGASYTFAQAQALFAAGFTYGVTGPSGVRVNLDQYHH